MTDEGNGVGGKSGDRAAQSLAGGGHTLEPSGGVLDGRMALVTGGTSGIGRAIAEGFLAAGACVVVNGRSRDRGDAVIEEWKGYAGRVQFIAADVSRGEDCDHLVDESIECLGGLDVLVNNCGGMVRTGKPSDFVPIHEQTDDAMNFSWNMNLMTAFRCSRRALPRFIAQRFGRVINISSVAGKIAFPRNGPYVIGKHALHGLTKVIAAENGTLGITSNAICVGSVETEMMRSEGSGFAEALGLSYEDFKRSCAEGSLVKRLLDAEEISAIATLLASTSGGAITGQCISVDGGIILSG